MACSRFPVKQWITQGGRRSTNLWKLLWLYHSCYFFCSHVNFKLGFCSSYQISTFWPPPCKDADHLRIMMTRMVVMMTIVIMTKTTFQGCQPSPGEHHVHVGTGVFPIHKPIAPGRRQRLEITEDFKSHWVQYFIFTKVAVNLKNQEQPVSRRPRSEPPGEKSCDWSRDRTRQWRHTQHTWSYWIILESIGGGLILKFYLACFGEK